MMKNQKGRFVVEMIVILALLAIFSPMIYIAQVEKNQKNINANNAEQIISLASAVNAFLQTNMTTISTPLLSKLSDTLTLPEVTTDPIVTEIPLNEEAFAPFLPPGLTEGTTFANRLFKDYKVGIRRAKTTGGVKVSAFVIAVPKAVDGLGTKMTQDISSMLGAMGGYVDGSTVLGNAGVWEIPDINDETAFLPGIADGSIIANVDFYVEDQVISSSGKPAISDPTSDVGYLHRDESEPVENPELLKDGYDEERSDDGTTMFKDLRMGIGGDDTKERYSFTGVGDVSAAKSENTVTCDPNTDKGCLDTRFNNDLGGTNEYGASCGQNEPCISVNGKLDTEAFLIRPAGTTMLDDIRIGQLKGVKLTELIPPMILLEVHRNKINGNTITPSKKCPTGYLPFATVIPVKWSSDLSKSMENTAWPFYAMNFKNNTDDANKSVGLWGSGYRCADVHLSANNMLAHYIDTTDGNNVKIRAYMGDASDIMGGNRDVTENANFTVTSSSDTSFSDPKFSYSCTDGTKGGKLKIHLDGYDRCGISNISSAFACNEELLTVAQRDFNDNTNGASLVRWEFYHPPEAMNLAYGGIDLYGTVIPNNTGVTVTYPDGSSKANTMQTTSWTVKASTDTIEYDVYLYCKYMVQAFEKK